MPELCQTCFFGLSIRRRLFIGNFVLSLLLFPLFHSALFWQNTFIPLTEFKAVLSKYLLHVRPDAGVTREQPDDASGVDGFAEGHVDIPGSAAQQARRDPARDLQVEGVDASLSPLQQNPHHRRGTRQSQSMSFKSKNVCVSLSFHIFLDALSYLFRCVRPSVGRVPFCEKEWH